MFVSTKRESYDGSFRLVLYRPGPDGKLGASLDKSDFDEEIDSFFAQRAAEYERLTRSLLEGRVSPIGFWMAFRGLSAADVAARTRIGRPRVEKHSTWEGFGSATVEMLGRYSRVFDVDVADFFQTASLEEGIEVTIVLHRDRMLEEVRIRKVSP